MNSFERQEMSPDTKIINSLKFSFESVQKDFDLLRDLYNSKPNSENNEGVLVANIDGLLGDPYSGIAKKLSDIESAVDLAVESGSIDNIVSELEKNAQNNLLIEYIKKYISGSPRPHIEPSSTLEDIVKE